MPRGSSTTTRGMCHNKNEKESSGSSNSQHTDEGTAEMAAYAACSNVRSLQAPVDVAAASNDDGANGPAPTMPWPAV